MPRPNPQHDDVIVLTEDDMRVLSTGNGSVRKTVGGNTYVVTPNEAQAKVEMKGLYVGPIDLANIRKGLAADYGGHDVSIVHEDYAGTPKSREAAAERLFELFREEDGRAKNVAQEALHLLGYEVEKDVSYRLRDTRP